MDFHKLIDTLQSPPEEGLPEDIYDNVRSAYDTLSNKADAAGAKIESLTKENAGLNDTITGLNDTVSGLKAKSYDLMTKVGLTDDERPTQDDAPEETGGIDDFFNGK